MSSVESDNTLRRAIKYAAPMLEFYNFDENSRIDMECDLLEAHSKFNRQKCNDFIDVALRPENIAIIKEHIAQLRNELRSRTQRNLEFVMAVDHVDYDLHDALYSPDFDDGPKYWYYDLYPEFSPDEIRHQFAVVVSLVIDRRMKKLTDLESINVKTNWYVKCIGV